MTPGAATAIDAPQVSVVVPVFRDWQSLDGLLEALAGQTWRDFEVVVVDNEPEAGKRPPATPQPLAAVRTVPCARPGAYAARNVGAEAARGRVLVFTDADCRPGSGWLAALARAFERLPGRILAGPVEVVPGPDPGAWEIFDTVRGMPQEVFLRHGYAVTANLAIEAALFRRLGGFDVTRLSGGDAEFCRRAGRQGIGRSLVAEAKLRHPARRSKAELVRKARRIKGGQVASGPFRRRAIWTLRSLFPPLREMAAYLASGFPWSWRLTACRVRMILWGVELAELFRLILRRQPPERR